MDGVIHTEIFWGFLAGGSVLPKYWRHLPIFIPCLSNNDFSRFQYIEFITLDISLDSIVKKWVGSPPPRKRRENLKQPFLAHFWSKWADFLHEALLSHTLSGKLVTSHPTSHPPSHPSGLPPAQPPLGKSCQIRPIFAGLVNSPITWLHIKN